jgi:hypothetical protein
MLFCFGMLGLATAILLIFSRFYNAIAKFSTFAVQNFQGMKKILIIILVLSVVVLTSCKKTRYCRCTTIQNEEVVNLGEEYYTIEDGSSCSDKSKEIVGWGQVICTEVSEYEVTGENPSWWENLFNNNNNKP